MIWVVGGEYRNRYKTVVREMKVTGHSEEFGADGRIILKLVLSQYGGGCGLDLLGQKQGLTLQKSS